MTEQSNAIEQRQHVPSADEGRTRERERERQRHRKGEESRAQRAHTTVAFSGRRTSGREQTGSACRTAGGVRVAAAAAEAEQKSKRSTHTVNTRSKSVNENLFCLPLCATHLSISLLLLFPLFAQWPVALDATETMKRRLIQIRSRN